MYFPPSSRPLNLTAGQTILEAVNAAAVIAWVAIHSGSSTSSGSTTCSAWLWSRHDDDSSALAMARPALTAWVAWASVVRSAAGAIGYMGTVTMGGGRLGFRRIAAAHHLGGHRLLIGTANGDILSAVLFDRRRSSSSISAATADDGDDNNDADNAGVK